MSVSFHQPPSRRRTRVTQLTRPAPTSDDVSDFRTHGRTPNELSQCQPVPPHPAIVPRPMEAPPMGSKLNAAQLGLERNWAARSDRTGALGGDGTAGGLGTTTYAGPEMVDPTYHGHDESTMRLAAPGSPHRTKPVRLGPIISRCLPSSKHGSAGSATGSTQKIAPIKQRRRARAAGMHGGAMPVH